MNTFIADLAARSPFLILDDDVYMTSKNLGKDYLRFENSSVTLGLIPAGNICELVKFYNILNKEKIYELKKTFIESQVQYDFKGESDRREELNRENLFKFIVKDLMPFLSGHKESLVEILGETTQTHKEPEDKKKISEEEVLKSFEGARTRLYEKQNKYNEKFQPNDDGVSYFKKLINNKNLFVFDQSVYTLNEENQDNLGLNINLKGDSRTVKPVFLKELNTLECEYRDFLEWKFKVESIAEFSDYIKEKQRIKLQVLGDLEEIMHLNEFSQGDIGFMQNNDRVYLYHKIPAFAMLDPRPIKKGICYEFPDLRVAMKIQYSDDRVYLNDPVLIEPIWHPFVSKDNTPFQELCGGRVPKRNSSPQLEWVAKALDDAKNLVMNGLTPRSIMRHDGNEENGGSYFGTPLDEKLKCRTISVKDARKKKLPLTNKWKWEDSGE